ncbi:site-specific integrase [Brevundimonas vesicularis]|nr:site-specific integrase [Brevundimonas vesicularis]
MAFVTDKEELKPGLVIFRRGDLQTRDWYCRVRLPKATRYKTIALKTPDITTARTLAYDHESEVRFALKRNLPVFNRPFSAVAKDYIAEQRLRAQRGEITPGRVKLIESVVKNQLNPYVGKTQIDLIALDRWQNYPSWRRSLGQGRMTRHGNVRPMTDAERDAAKALADDKAKQKGGAVGKQTAETPEPENTDWIIVSDATIRFEMKIYRAIINDAVSKQEAPPHHRIEGMPSLEKQRRDAFSLEEYRRLHTHARTKWVDAAKTETARWYRAMVYQFVLIMCNTGMRPSEARNLRWRDVMEATDKNGQPVTVLSVRGKGKSRQLVAPSSNVGKYLDRIRAIAVSTAPEAPVFSSAIGPAVVANSRERGGRRESVGVVRAQAQPSHGPADCRCGGEGAARPFPLLNGDPRRRRRRPHAGLKPARASDRHPAGMRRQAARSERSGDRARPLPGTRPACLLDLGPDPAYIPRMEYETL